MLQDTRTGTTDFGSRQVTRGDDDLVQLLGGFFQTAFQVA